MEYTATIEDCKCVYDGHCLTIVRNNEQKSQVINLLSYTDFIDTCLDIIEKW